MNVAKKSRIPKLLIVLPVLVLVGLLIQFRQSLLILPRVRVGPLHVEKPDINQLKFFVIGDSGSGRPEQGEVAKAMEVRCIAGGPFDAILMLGDNIYPSGVTSTEDPLWQERIFQPYGSDCLDDLPIYAVLGNHDYKGNPAAQIEMTLVNKRWYMPNRFYSMRFGSLLTLVAFDSELSEFCFKDNFCTYDYMLKAVKAYPATWTIVMSHHPLTSTSERGHGHQGGFREIFIKPFVCDKVDAWLAGHAHHMEHQIDPACRLELFLSGGAGADLYPVEENAKNVSYAESRHGFLELSLAKDKMVAEFYDISGALRHRSEKLPTQRL
jgi:tartrate-resistant acid phosphatase type 5